MSTAEVMAMALRLKASERHALLEMLQKSLDKPDPEVDQVWIEEAERRIGEPMFLLAYVLLAGLGVLTTLRTGAEE